MPLHVCQRAVGSSKVNELVTVPIKPRSCDMIYGQSSLGCHRSESCHCTYVNELRGPSKVNELVTVPIKPRSCDMIYGQPIVRFLPLARGFLRVVRIQTNKFISNDHTGRWACNYMHPTRTPTALSYRTLRSTILHSILFYILLLRCATVPLCPLFLCSTAP